MSYNLGRQGLDRRIELLPIDVRGLPANGDFTVYAMRGQQATALLTATSNAMGANEETLAFVHFFLNRYDRIVVVPAMH